MDNRIEFLNTLEKDTSYDWIANNYYKLDKEELKDIVLELLYAIHAHHNSHIEKVVLADVSAELQERWCMDDFK